MVVHVVAPRALAAVAAAVGAARVLAHVRGVDAAPAADDVEVGGGAGVDGRHGGGGSAGAAVGGLTAPHPVAAVGAHGHEPVEGRGLELGDVPGSARGERGHGARARYACGRAVDEGARLHLEPLERVEVLDVVFGLRRVRGDAECGGEVGARGVSRAGTLARGLLSGRRRLALLGRVLARVGRGVRCGGRLACGGRGLIFRGRVRGGGRGVARGGAIGLGGLVRGVGCRGRGVHGGVCRAGAGGGEAQREHEGKGGAGRGLHARVACHGVPHGFGRGPFLRKVYATRAVAIALG